MAKLHELLAAQGSAQAQADKCRSDLLTTFEKKRHLFEEKRVTFQSNEEGKPPVTEEQSDIQTTVLSELKWISDIWARALDLAYQIDHSNMTAKADVKLDDGTVLLKDVPTTALMQLEKRAGEIHTLVSAIPTLDPAKGFRPDPARGDGISVAREVTKSRTRKDQRPIVLYDATKEHPAQTQLITQDVVIGTIHAQEWSALLTPARKAEMLDRAEELRRAFKTARSRANAGDASTETCGRKLLDFVFTGSR